MNSAEAFARALKHVLSFEGGYVDHPSDPGGATNMGITRKTLAAWRRVSPWWSLDKQAVRALEEAEVADIYRARYWLAAGADQVPEPIAVSLFDFAVNSGVGRAVRMLQAIVGAGADGIFGPVTRSHVGACVAARGVVALVEELTARRLGFLEKLKIYAVFGRGWRRRVAATRNLSIVIAGTQPQPPVSPTADHHSQPDKWSTPMDFLNGYKTYVVAAAMVVIGLAQILGVDLPSFEGHTAGQLLMEGLAIIFLRKGLKSEIANA